MRWALIGLLLACLQHPVSPPGRLYAAGEDVETAGMLLPQAHRVGASLVAECPARFTLPLETLRLEKWQSIEPRGYSCAGHLDVRLVTIETALRRGKLKIKLWVRQDEGQDKMISFDFRLLDEGDEVLLTRRLVMELDEGELNWDSISFDYLPEPIVRHAETFEMIMEKVEAA